ncbi:MAG: hypothetical protein NT020_12775 [Chloroflexales bacterium]|nr:hypothetical protein [Chloroflexales bacterium]
MDHVKHEQSFGDEIMTQIPEAQHILKQMGIQGSHTRLQMQAEASSLDVSTLLAVMDMASRRRTLRITPDTLN